MEVRIAEGCNRGKWGGRKGRRAIGDYNGGEGGLGERLVPPS